eukprot:1160944-Pelagomonas_calceolata.AAC.16
MQVLEITVLGTDIIPTFVTLRGSTLARAHIQVCPWESARKIGTLCGGHPCPHLAQLQQRVKPSICSHADTQSTPNRDRPPVRSHAGTPTCSHCLRAHLAQQQQRVQPPALEDKGASHNGDASSHHNVSISGHPVLNIPHLESNRVGETGAMMSEALLVKSICLSLNVHTCSKACVRLRTCTHVR